MKVEVPLPSPGKKESALYARIKNTLAQKGKLIRLENLIVPGLPDNLFVYNRKTIFIELKILKNSKITMPKFQYAMAVELRRHIFHLHHWYFVHEDDGLGRDIISAYRFTDLVDIPPEAKGEIVSLDLRQASPTLVFSKLEDLDDWFMLLDSVTMEKGTEK